MTRAMRHSNFKDRLCYIDGDGRMLHGTPPDVWFLRTDRDDFGTSMPFKSPGGVHFISCAAAVTGSATDWNYTYGNPHFVAPLPARRPPAATSKISWWSFAVMPIEIL